MGLDVGRHLIAVLAGHKDVGQDNVRTNLFKFSNCSFAVAYRNNLEVGVRKRLFDQTLDRRAVVRQQYCSSHTSSKNYEGKPQGGGSEKSDQFSITQFSIPIG